MNDLLDDTTLAALVAKLRPPPKYSITDDVVCSYDENLNMIYIARELKQHPEIWRHECGHAIDFEGKMRGKSFRYRSVVLSEGDAIKNAPDEQFAAVGIKGKLAGWYGSMTANRFGFGHASEYYWHDPLSRVYESFANYVALAFGPKAEDYREILYQAAPKTCAGFDQILAEVAAR